jgi:hypothetical protein
VRSRQARDERADRVIAGVGGLLTCSVRR